MRKTDSATVQNINWIIIQNIKLIEENEFVCMIPKNMLVPTPKITIDRFYRSSKRYEFTEIDIHYILASTFFWTLLLVGNFVDLTVAPLMTVSNMLL